jgi:Leucine-rich repeat (LRR) protein
MTDQENLKISIYATDAQKICEIEDVKSNYNLEEINILKVVQSESLVSMEVRYFSIEGLENFRNLVELDLSCNKISFLTGMDNLHDLRFLDLSCNQLTNLDGLGNLFNIEKIILSHNKISSLKGLQNV